MSKRIQTGDSEEVIAHMEDAGGNPLTGLADVSTSIRRKSDNFYFDFDPGELIFKGSGWVQKSQTMAEIDATSAAGDYSITFVAPAADTYFFRPESPSAFNVPQHAELVVGGFIDNLDRSSSDLMTMIEALRPGHTHCANAQIFYVDPVNGDSFANGNTGGIFSPLLSVQDCHDNLVVSNRHDVISIIPGNPSGTTIMNEAVTLTKNYFFIFGPGRDLIWRRNSNGDTIDVTGNGVGLAKFQLETHTAGSGKGVHAVGSDFFKMQYVWINDTRGTGIHLSNCSNCQILDNILEGSGVSGAGQGIEVDNSGGGSEENVIRGNIISGVQGDGIKLSGNTTEHTHVIDNKIHGSTGWAINIQPNVSETLVVENESAGNATGDINDQGTDTHSTTNSWDIDGIVAKTNLIPDDFQAILDRQLGLAQENYYLDTVSVNSVGFLTIGRIRLYSVAGSVGTDNDVTDTYDVTANYDGNNKLLNYGVVKQ